MLNDPAALCVTDGAPADQSRSTMKYRYEYRRNGVTLRTQWSDRETARERMAERIGPFHEPGRVSSDGDSRFDGSHPGCARNGGLLSVEVAK